MNRVTRRAVGEPDLQVYARLGTKRLRGPSDQLECNEGARHRHECERKQERAVGVPLNATAPDNLFGTERSVRNDARGKESDGVDAQ